MASKLPGKGTQLLMSIASASAYVAVAQRVELKAPSVKVGIRKTTDLDSTYEDKEATIPDLGQLAGTLFYDPNDTMHALFRSRVVTPLGPGVADLFKIIYADSHATSSAQEVVKGILTEFTPTGIKYDDTLQAEFTIELSKSYSFTAGS
jgi:hypothetical protein